MTSEQQHRQAAEHKAPGLPHRIALVDATPAGNEQHLEFIFDDFADAFAFYARHDALDTQAIATVACTKLPLDDGFDTLVLGFSLDEDAGEKDITELCSSLAQAASALPQGARVYVLAALAGIDFSQALPAFQKLEEACGTFDLTWCNGLAATHVCKREAYAAKPRMGSARRGLSEAIDRFILAIRCGADAGRIGAALPWRLRFASHR